MAQSARSRGPFVHFDPWRCVREGTGRVPGGCIETLAADMLAGGKQTESYIASARFAHAAFAPVTPAGVPGSTPPRESPLKP